MMEEGFEKIYQLDGGVINYGLQKGSEYWKGKLFVFDDRLAVPISEESPKPISKCKYCGCPNDRYANCANTDCNELFLVCDAYLDETRGCCSSECEHAPRVRDYQSNGKPFRKWDHKEKVRWQEDASVQA